MENAHLHHISLFYIVTGHCKAQQEKKVKGSGIHSIEILLLKAKYGSILNWTAACFYYALHWRVWNDGEKHFGTTLQYLEQPIFNDHSAFVLSSYQSNTIVRCLYVHEVFRYPTCGIHFYVGTYIFLLLFQPSRLKSSPSCWAQSKRKEDAW